MYPAHLAAGLAIKAHVPKAPTWALMIGVFLPDFVWVALGLAGIEPSQGPAFFDDWSHSLAMVLVWAVVFALLFWRKGWAIMFAVGLAVLSHFLLDLPIHPKPLALFPHSAAHIGWSSWNFGQEKFWLGATHYWWLELAVLLALILVYLLGAGRERFAMNLVWASCILVVGIHLLSLA